MQTWKFPDLFTDLPDGPWKDEPDRVQWHDETTGLPCRALRTELGVWCGYVGVNARHPSYGKHYDEVDVDVHGGLTFSGFCKPQNNDPELCLIPDGWESEDIYWLGFDAAHAWDLIPGMLKYGVNFPNAQYRDLNYVREECRKLAEQLARLKQPEE